MAKAKTHFVVVRRNGRPAGHDGTYVLLPGEVREATFATDRLARQDAARREADARSKVNPFRCGTTWADRSHLPEPVFCDFLRDGGVEPPAAKPTRSKKKPPAPPDWVKWWEEEGAKLPDAQRQRVWEGLDRLRFYDVREQPVKPVAYAVVEVQWNYNDEWYYPGPEGGHSHAAYRSRERAEQECERRNDEARERWRRDLRLPAAGAAARGGEMHELFFFDMQTRRFAGQDPFGPPTVAPERTRAAVYGEESDEDSDLEPGEFGVDEVPFYEVVEFELEEGG